MRSWWVAALCVCAVACDEQAASGGALEAQQSAGGAARRLVVPAPAPDTSIDPALSAAVCDAAIARNRAAPWARSDAGAASDRDAGSRDGGPPHLLSPESVRRVIRDGLGDVALCHEQALSEDPRLAGRVVVRFVVGPSGSVLAATVFTSTIAQRFLQQCLVNAVRGWRFDAPEGGGVVTINYPFNLLQPE
jgi:TonB family protein